MATALIRHCDECRKGDKRNDYRTGWTSAPDCGGECCTGKVSREVRAHELRTRSEGVRVTAVGGAGGRGTVVLGNNGMDRGTLLVEKRA